MLQNVSPIFARITKVDEETRTVYGRATQEIVDRDNEVFDYDSSKPLFQQWSAEVSQDTDGKSLGNVRSMHGNVSAGVLKDIQYDDAEKAIDIAAKIVDDNEWKKVQEGCYTGFSIGGRYSKKWPDIINGKMVNRYTAVPSEISIVDRPCCPAAKFFTVHKRDGSTRTVLFQPMTELEKTFSPPVSATSGLQSYDEEGAKRTSKAAPREQDPNADDAIATDPNGSFGGKSATKREFSDAQREDAADADAALPDGSFPIKTAADVKNAIRAVGRAKNKAKAKAHIIARAKALGATAKLPEGWNVTSKKADSSAITSMSLDELTKFLERRLDDVRDVFSKNQTFEFSKGVYDVSSLASLIPQLSSLAYGAERERQIEGDASDVPEKLRAAAAELLSVLSDMAAEESEEIKNGTTAEDVLADAADGMSPGLYRADVSDFAKHLSKALGIPRSAELAKEGRRHSAADLELVQKVHDASAELGACCKGPHEFDGDKVSPGSKEMSNANKADAVSTEGNKRGASVTDPKLPVESGNANDKEPSSSQGQESPDDDARKRKARAAAAADATTDDDEDEDDKKSAKSKKARKSKSAMKVLKALMAELAKSDDEDEDEEDDEDEDEEDDKKKPSKSRKATKSDSAEIADALVGALAKAGMLGGNMIPRVAPNLMSVGKDGSVQKLDVETLKKSVSRHPNDAAGTFANSGDQDTCTLIKAIHAKRIMLDPVDLNALGQVGALR